MHVQGPIAVAHAGRHRLYGHEVRAFEADDQAGPCAEVTGWKSRPPRGAQQQM